MANKRIYKVTEQQIKLIAESEIPKLKKEDIENMIGDEFDRRIEYPAPGELNAMENGKDIPNDVGNNNTEDNIDNIDNIDPAEMKTPPHELLAYLDKIEEAKSILSKIAAKEENEDIKNRIYSHYEKASKLIFELIKEFGIVH